VGLEGGYTYNNLHTNTLPISTVSNGQGGFSIGIPLIYDLPHHLAISATPHFLQKGYSLDRTGAFAGYYETYKNSYIQLPVSLQASLTYKKWQGFINAGVYAAYWITGRVQGVTPGILNIDSSYFTPSAYNEKYTFDNTRDRRMEFGWTAGAGISYALTEKYAWRIGVSYAQALTDQQKNYMERQSARFNRTFLFTTGILVHLNKTTK